MMRKLIFLAALSICLQSQAQDKKISTPEKFQLGVFVAPEYHFRKLENNDGSSSSAEIISLRNKQEEGNMRPRIGLSVGYMVNRKLILETGVEVVNKMYHTEKHELYYFVPDPSQPTHASFEYRHQQLAIPLRVRVMLCGSSFRFSANAGLVYDVMLNARVARVGYYSDGHKDRHYESRPANFKNTLSATFGAAVERTICNNLSIRLQPNYRFQLTKSTDTPIVEYLRSTGIELGVVYGF